MAKSAADKTAIVIGSGALVAGAIAMAQSQTASAANQKPAGGSPGGGTIMLDEATMNLLIAMAQSGTDLQTLVQKVIDSLDSLSLDVKGYPPNADSVESTRIPIVALDLAVQLPDIPVPDGMSLLIKGWPANRGTLFIARSSSSTVNPNQSYPLLPNENVRYYIKNANALYVAGITAGGISFAGDSIVLTVESRQGGG